MKNNFYFLMLSTITLTNFTTMLPLLPPSPQIKQLSTILLQDNSVALQQFITANPTFQWAELYSHLPWTWKTESQTPLSAATWTGAQNCLNYLLSKNVGNIKASLNGMPSSRGFTPLHYAQHPPSTKSYPKTLLPGKTSAKVTRPALSTYQNIAKTLKKAGATA